LCNIRFLGFLWNYLTRWFARKITTHNSIRVLLKWTLATCKFGLFIVQHQLIDVIAPFTTCLTAQLSNRSSSLYAHNHASMESSFTLFSMVFGVGSLLVMTKVSLWLNVVVWFK
jgi:hypothetical protein